MNSFQCNFANATSTKKLGTPQVARRYVAAVTVFVLTAFNYREHSCGPEAANNYTWNYSNCTKGPQQPFYWFQAERNNFFQGTYDPPLYKDVYNFRDGAQLNIFEDDSDSTDNGPSSIWPTSTSVPANRRNVDPTPSSSSSPSQGPVSEWPQGNHARNNPRDDVKVQAARRAWGSHRRRYGVRNHHP